MMGYHRKSDSKIIIRFRLDRKNMKITQNENCIVYLLLSLSILIFQPTGYP